jgi:hypothetical protein
MTLRLQDWYNLSEFGGDSVARDDARNSAWEICAAPAKATQDPAERYIDACNIIMAFAYYHGVNMHSPSKRLVSNRGYVDVLHAQNKDCRLIVRALNGTKNAPLAAALVERCMAEITDPCSRDDEAQSFTATLMNNIDRHGENGMKHMLRQAVREHRKADICAAKDDAEMDRFIKMGHIDEGVAEFFIEHSTYSRRLKKAFEAKP